MQATFDPRTELQRLAAEYSARTEAIRRDLGRQHSGNLAEQAVQRQNEAVLRNLLAEAEQELAATRRALQRLDEGHYGQCRHCGEVISQQRLAALPTTELCRQCAAQQGDD